MMATFNQRVAATLVFIDAVLSEFKAPAVLWSSGKDSMVLLHLMRRARPDLPVIFFREPFQPRRYSFAQDIIMDWDLKVYEWPPVATAVAFRNDVTSLVHRFQVAPQHCIDLPVDIVEDGAAPPPDQTTPVCALDILRRPKAGFTAPWDVMFTGAKSSDVDQLAGAVPLSVSLWREADGPAFAFPLRTWTDGDVWQYIEQEKVPYQMDRYEKVNSPTDEGVWSYRERANKAGNPDYLIGCQRCLCADGPATVWCPKLKMEINNVADKVPRMDSLLPGYMGKV